MHGLATGLWRRLGVPDAVGIPAITSDERAAQDNGAHLCSLGPAPHARLARPVAGVLARGVGQAAAQDAGAGQQVVVQRGHNARCAVRPREAVGALLAQAAALLARRAGQLGRGAAPVVTDDGIVDAAGGHRGGQNIQGGGQHASGIMVSEIALLSAVRRRPEGVAWRKTHSIGVAGHTGACGNGMVGTEGPAGQRHKPQHHPCR